MSAVTDDVLGFPQGLESQEHELPAEPRGHAPAFTEVEDDDLEALADDDFDDEFDDDFEAELGGEYDFDEVGDDVADDIELSVVELAVPECGDIGEAFEEVEVDGEGDLDPAADFGENTSS